MDAAVAVQLEGVRRELRAYLSRLVLRDALAEELVQATFLRAIESGQLPPEESGRRAWLFRVATNLAFDTLKRHAHRRESLMSDLRTAAEGDPEFLARSAALAGTPETRAIAREHVAACFSCVLRNLPDSRAATLLLAEVHGFTVAEVARMLEARPAQVKNWLQEARATMAKRYEATCALVRKEGVCHQCVELAGFMRADPADPMPHGASVGSRVQVMRSMREQPWQPWHRMMFDLLDDLQS